MHHFDGWQTMEGRHLVFAYAAVLLVQLGYAGWVATQWAKLGGQAKKATKSQ